MQEQLRILGIARNVVETAVQGFEPREPEVGVTEHFLHEKRGCFVTLLDLDGGLRGCIGTFEANEPLWRTVAQMAVASTRDPRFIYTRPVTERDLDNLYIEVSVLTPRQQIEDPLEMRIGVDGIVIEGEVNGQKMSGCFLPQVAPEQGWDAKQTLEFCCAHKMGLAPDAWETEPGLRFHVFQSVIIDESVVGRGA
ncbi:MAG: AmmeMemoRadiSam system protein A [Planctomycetota bacterium]